MTLHNKPKKIISSLLIISILLPTILLAIPSKGYAFWGVFDVSINPVGDISSATGAAAGTASAASQFSLLGFKIEDIATELAKQLLKVAAKKILAEMTQATVNWINSGFHGSPLFLENPESFFKDIAKWEVQNLVDMIGYDSFKFPFGKQTALNVIASYKSQLATNAQYTLSKVINDKDLLVKYRNDFNYGGWNGFLINTQYPQNNYLGFQGIIQQNLASKLEGTLQTPAKKVQDALQQGMGFLSPQTCPSNPSYNNGTNEFLKPKFKAPTYSPPASATEAVYGGEGGETFEEYEARRDTAKAAFDAYETQYNNEYIVAGEQWDAENTCPGGLVSTTPGSVAANQVMNALNVPFLTTALDGALGNSLAAIFDALLNKLLDTGLNAMKSSISSTSSTEDNWSYNGDTLTSSTTTSGTTTTVGGTATTITGVGALNIPQNVSVRVGETTSTAISGGDRNYSIKTQPNVTIATARIDVSGSSGPKLTVTGIAPTTASVLPRTTSVIVQDSSASSPDVTVTITVNAAGVLAVNPPSISTDINTSTPIMATISGGNGDYSIQTGPNRSIAVAQVSGASLIVIGVGKGETSVEIKDSANPVKTVRVNIKINGPDNLVIASQNVSVDIGLTTSTTISGGTAPYKVVPQVPASVAVATAEILPATPTTLSITGRASGTTVITVEDSSTPVKNISVSITILAPMGNCHKSLGGEDINIDIQTDEVTCASFGGEWTPNIPIIPLVITPSSVSVGIGFSGNQRTAQATITGGSGTYSIISMANAPNTTVATAQISGNILTVTAGNTKGSTFVRVKDSSNTNPQTFDVIINVN